MSDKTVKIEPEKNVAPKVTARKSAPKTTVAKTSQTTKTTTKRVQKTPMIKDYKITGIIGEGGMGKVYKGIHPTLKQEIILKELKIRDKETRERFLREAKVMLSFRHENIVQVYDHFKGGTSTYIAMEYVKGMSLSQLIKMNKQIPPAMALFIFYQAALGLHHAHIKKVVHRDVKPQNILISENGDVKIIDFGIATQKGNNAEKSLTSTGAVIGTPAYMSPEQFSTTKEITYQSDIYSLGVVLYEMLTGVVPFRNEFSSEVLAAIAHGRFVPASKLVKNLPDICKKILAKTFNPDIRKRYKNFVPVINLLKKYFKKYNVYELKASVKCLLKQEKDLLKLPYYSKNLELAKKSKRSFKIAVFFVSFLLFAFFFFKANLHYEWILQNQYSRMNLSFNCPNRMDPETIYYRIDNQPSKKATFKNGETIFKKSIYLKEGTHRIKISSGSYDTIKTVDLLPISMQKRDKNTQNGMNVNVSIPGLDNKDVMVYFRFWDEFANSEYPIFQFENYRTITNKLLQEEDSLYIWDKNANVRLKDYIREKLSPPTSYPFYSDREYAFIVKDFERNGIEYLDKRFKLKFGVDDRTVITHIPLVRCPAVVKVVANVNDIQLKINGKSSGHIFSKYKDTQKYLIMPYKSIKPNIKGQSRTFIFYLPPGKCSMQFGNGRIIEGVLKSNQDITIKVQKEKGKFVY
jgi:serine/threonine-protein kinase